MTVMPPEAPELEVVDPMAGEVLPCYMTCDHAAAWMARTAPPRCAHVPPAVLLCDGHHDWILSELAHPGNWVACTVCEAPVTIRSWERL